LRDADRFNANLMKLCLNTYNRGSIQSIYLETGLIQLETLLHTEVLKILIDILNARKTQVQDAVCITLWMYQRKYTTSLILKKKDISQVIYAGTKILKTMDYLNIYIFKIEKNFYLDRGSTNSDMIPLRKLYLKTSLTIITHMLKTSDQ
jgi:hypothetical protein